MHPDSPGIFVLSLFKCQTALPWKRHSCLLRRSLLAVKPTGFTEFTARKQLSAFISNSLLLRHAWYMNTHDMYSTYIHSLIKMMANTHCTCDWLVVNTLVCLCQEPVSPWCFSLWLYVQYLYVLMLYLFLSVLECMHTFCFISLVCFNSFMYFVSQYLRKYYMAHLNEKEI